MLRKWLIALVLLSGATGATVQAAEPTHPFFTLHDLGHGVWAAISPPKSKAGANVREQIASIDTFCTIIPKGPSYPIPRPGGRHNLKNEEHLLELEPTVTYFDELISPEEAYPSGSA